MDFASEEWCQLPPTEKARSLTQAAAEARTEGHDQAACEYYLQALSLYRGLGDGLNTARTLARLAYLAGRADFGDGLDVFTRPQRLSEEALEFFRTAGDRAGEAEALIMAAGPEGNAMLEEALALARETGDQELTARALDRLATLLTFQDPEQSRASYTEAIRIYRECGNKSGTA